LEASKGVSQGVGIKRRGAVMPGFKVKVVVTYDYEIQADSEAEAEAEGQNYENYRYFGSIDSIEVEELESDEEE
jgi:hypothetical protein